MILLKDVAQEMTVSSVRIRTYLQDTSGYLAAHLPWRVNLASLVCDVDQ